MLPIPGTSKVAHLEENVAAAEIELSDAEFEALSGGDSMKKPRAAGPAGFDKQRTASQAGMRSSPGGGSRST